MTLSAPVRDYGDTRAEHAALREGAALLDLSHFGVLRVEGRDRIQWLRNLITTEVQALADGAGAFGLLLEAKAHVLADFILLRESETLWLYSSPRAIQNLLVTLRRAIFREKVTLTDVSAQFTTLSLQGPRAKDTVEKLFQLSLALAPFHFVRSVISNDQLLITCSPRAFTDGYDVLLPRERIEEIWDALIAAGARPVGCDALNVARVEQGRAWYGDDYDETTLAPEARLEKFIPADRGCYPGQEVIARIRNRGHVNRLLMQFELAGARVPERSDRALADGKEVGWVTSAVWSYAQNAPRALGYLRIEYAQDGARVQIVSAHAPQLPGQTAIARIPRA